MTMVIKTLAIVAAGTVLATSALARSGREIRGASPYVATGEEPAPTLIVDSPLPEGLAQGVFWLRTEWRTCASYLCSGRAPFRYLHVWGICTSRSTTCPGGGRMRVTTTQSISAGLPSGQHKMKIELVDASQNVFAGQVMTLTFIESDHDGANAHSQR
jgi:Family of unknown function (DUF6130)